MPIGTGQGDADLIVTDIPHVARVLSGWDWFTVLRRTVREFIGKNVLGLAGSVAFFVQLAFVPAIAAFISLYGLVADVNMVSRHLSLLGTLLPADALSLVNDQVTRIASGGSRTLSFAFLLSFAISLWSANAGVKAMFDGLNAVEGLKERRSFVVLNLQSLGLTLGAIVFGIVALTGVIVLPAVMTFVGYRDIVDYLVLMLRWPVLLAMVLVALAVLYWAGPSPDPKRVRPAAFFSVGALASAFLWLAASGLFSWYVTAFGTYNQTYGSLGAVIIFMTWVWISTAIVLLGAGLNVQIARTKAERG